MKKVFAVILAVSLLCLCGCGTSDEVYVPTGNGLTWDEDYAGSVATQATEAPEQELILTYYPGETMNPYDCADFTNRALFPLLYQSLFVVDRDYQVEPMLCSTYTVSPDMTEYIFYIEENVNFSDGHILTAEDVCASLKAAKSSDVYKGRFLHVKSISLSEDGGVTITLDTPYENLPLILDIPIVRKDQVGEDHPSGTGPYTLDTASSSLRRRANWWCDTQLVVTAQTIPLLKAESPSQIRDAFQFDNLSLVCADPGSDRYADYRCDFELWDCENGIFLYLACSAGSTVFSNPQVRAAMTYAVDRDTLVDAYYRGFARSATLPASPQSPYYNQSLASRYAYDPVKFAQVINDQNLQGSTVKFLVNSDDTLRLRAARAIAGMLEECGLVVEMSELSGSDYTYALKTWDFDLYLGQTKLSATMDLTPFFATNGTVSWGGVNNVEAYTLSLQALENAGNYYTLHQTIMDNGLLCPVLFRSYAVYATRGTVSDLTPARDNIFYYSLGKTMEDALLQE